MLTAKIGIDRSDRSVRAVWPVGRCSLPDRRPTGMTSGPDRSDRSKRSPSRIRIFVDSVKRILCGISPPHPINIKGHGRLRDPIDQKHINTLLFVILHYFLSSSNPSSSNPNLLFCLRLRNVWRRSRWPADPRTIIRAPALTGSLPGERSSDFTVLHRQTGLTGPTALSIGAAFVPSLAARSSVFVCWP